MSSPHDPRYGTGPDGTPFDGDPTTRQPPQGGPWPQPQPGAPWQQPQGQPWQGAPQQGQPWQGAPQQGQPWQGAPQQGQPWQTGPQQGQPWQQPQGQPWPGGPQQGQPWQGAPQQAQPWQQPAGPQWSGGGVPPQTGGQPAAAQPGGTPPRKNKAALITAVAVVIALLAGLGVYLFAVKGSKGGGGQDTPVAAARQLFADVDNGDLIGLTDTFDPVEAQFVNDLAGDVIGQFKRLGLLNDSATVNNATGTNISIKGITFDDAAEETPLPDLAVVKLTGGTLTISPAQSTGVETDLYRQLVDAVQNKAADVDVPMTSMSEPTTIDIAQVIRDDNNGEAIRISTVQRDGEWYPSLFYTAADYWARSAGIGAVTAADRIDAKGADSPAAAVNGMIDALLKQDADGVIALLPPDEMSAVHAYGRKIVDAIGAGDTTTDDVTLDAQWTETDVTGGKLLSIKTLSYTSGTESGSIDIDQAAGSVTVTDGTDTQTFDADSISELIGAGELESIHPNMSDFVTRMLKAALGLGIVTTSVDGQWYVSPLRSYTGIFTGLLGGMEQRDIEMIIDLLNQ